MEILSINWTVETRKVAGLKLWDKNPRKISPEKYEMLKKRIVERGMHDVLKIDSDGTILSGNQRKSALEELGIEEVYCMVPERPLSEEERNKVGLESNINDGEYVYSLLGKNFDEDLMASVGFTPHQIDRAFDLKTEEVDTPTLGENSESSLGDIFQLGEHRLMCGDSTSPEDVSRLMGGVRANMVFTDPPYGVDYTTDKDVKIQNDDLKTGKLSDFLQKAFVQMVEHTTDDACFYVWHATSTTNEFRLALDGAKVRISQVLIWLKESFAFNRSDFKNCYEPCFYGWKKGFKHFVNAEIANVKDVWSAFNFEEFQDHLDIWYEKRDSAGDLIHPTQKPIKLAERALRKSSAVGHVVLDLFGGSGSTLMACEQMNRKAYLMELDPKYVDVIIKRWQNSTGGKAVKI